MNLRFSVGYTISITPFFTFIFHLDILKNNCQAQKILTVNYKVRWIPAGSQVIVPDPEVLAQLEMTQAELEAMRRQLLAVKDKERHLHGEKSQLHAELARVKGEVARLQADVLELEAFLAGRSQSDVSRDNGRWARPFSVSPEFCWL